MNRRKTGQIAASVIAILSFGWAFWASHISAIPQLRVYDGYWMMLGASVAILVVAPLVWRWRRERSLVAITIAVVVGSVAPLIVSALRHRMPVMVRLRGSWVLGGADMVAPALVIGFICLWFALREYRAEGARAKRG